MGEVIRVSDLKFEYPDGTSLHFHGLDFIVHERERVVILGPNGCGKSTLLFNLLGLLKPTKGEIQVLGVNPTRDYTKIRERIGALLQNPDQQIIAPTVWDDVSFSPRNYGFNRKEVEDLVNDVLQKLDIVHLQNKVSHYLSGGEKTKVALAGALVNNPELLILDEPFEDIDPTCRTDLANLLNRVNLESGTAMVLTTHNINVVPMIADTVYLIAEGGKIVGKGTPVEIFSQAELLSDCHIEPPVLSSFFFELKKYGINLEVSLKVDEAASSVAGKILSNKDNKCDVI